VTTRAKVGIALIGVLAYVALAVLSVGLIGEKWQLRVAGTAALGVHFGGCGRIPDGPGAPFMAEADRWVLLEEVTGVRHHDQRPSELEVTAVDDGSAGAYRYVLHQSFIPGIEWTLRNGGEVWLAMSSLEGLGPERVSYVVAFGPGGEPFLPGECMDHFRRFLAETSGDGFLREIVGKPPDELKRLFARYE
jgi:hypothetical protein